MQNKKLKTILTWTLAWVHMYCMGQAHMPDLSFSRNQWELDPGITISDEETLTITGNSEKYIRAKLPIKIDTAGLKDLYFYADVRLENIKNGNQPWARPKLRINTKTDYRIHAVNLTDDLQGQWFTAGLKIKNFRGYYRYDEIIIEFSLQNTEGTFEVRNPQLSTTPPQSSYTFPFQLRANPRCHLDIDSSKVRPFNNDLIGANSHHTGTPFGYEDKRVQELYRHSSLPSLRFPAGTLGNFYNWEGDNFYKDSLTLKHPLISFALKKGFKFAFKDYVGLMQATDASSILMFNIMYDNAKKNVKRLQNRLREGLNVSWVELGNENYFQGQNYGNVSNIDSYITHSRKVSQALKAVKPTLRTAVNIHHENIAEDPWALKLAKNPDYYDGVVIHPYIHPSTFLFNAYSGKVMLSSYRTILNYFKEYTKVFGNKPLLISEWAVLSHELPANFIQALGTADIFMAILRGSDDNLVQQAGIHIFFQYSPYHITTLYGWQWQTQEIVKTRLGVIYEMIVNTFKDSHIYAAVGKSTELEEDLPAINARAVKTPDGKIKVFAINKLPSTAPLKVSFDGRTYTGKHILESFSEKLLESRVYKLKEEPWITTKGTGGKIMLPPYSVNVITLSSKHTITDLPEPKTPEKASLEVFPNPVKDSFQIEGRNIDGAEVKLYDSRGQYMGIWKYRSSDKINIVNLPHGIYHLIIKTRDGLYTHKIHKE